MDKKVVSDKLTPIISHAFIMADGEILSAEELVRLKSGKAGLVSKAAVNTVAQPQGYNPKTPYDAMVMEPPFNTAILAKFLEVDEIHFRCVKTKVTDTVGRGFKIKKLDPELEIDAGTIKTEVEEVKSFVRGCNRYDKFDGVFGQAGMDFEAVGWGAIEVIRSFDKKIVKLNHIPAEDVRVLQGWIGFVIQEADGSKRFFQPFGNKVISTIRKDAYGNPEPFDIQLDGDWKNAEWNLKDRETFEDTGNISTSANELLFIPKVHPKSVYYGVPDFIPAIGHIIANVNIRDFFLQYFEHNTVPQYAVIVKGANLDENVKALIMSYFNQEVKGSSHKTLVIPIPAAGGDVDVVFERLENMVDMTGYDSTRKANQTAIMVAHGVSPAIIGIADSAELGEGKGTSQMENYRERIVEPNQFYWSTLINDMLRIGLGVAHAGVVFDPLSLENRSVLMEQDRQSVAMGAMTINQYIERNGLGRPINGGDRPFIMTPGGPIFIDQLSAPDVTTALDKMELELENLSAIAELAREREKLDVAGRKEDVKTKKEQRLRLKQTPIIMPVVPTKE